MATPGPLPSSTVITGAPGTDGTGAARSAPAVQVPQKENGILSRHDMMMLFHREIPMAMAKPTNGTTQANTASGSLLKSAAAGVEHVTTKVENLFHQLLPHGSDGGVTYTATVTLQKKILVLDLSDGVADSGDEVLDLLGQHVTFQLVSKNVDPKTGQVAVSEEVPILNWATPIVLVPTNFKYELDFQVHKDFGQPGAVIVKNRHKHEFLLLSIALKTDNKKVVNFPISSWVYNTELRGGRIFFSNEMYLPKDTPEGLKALREEELKNLRGYGTGERKFEDRIYDYDVYNDLGEPDFLDILKRPVLGGSKELPYPRRCRTGRSPSEKDPQSESRGNLLALFYIPRDEKFDQVKFSDFAADTIRSTQHAILPVLSSAVKDQDVDFNSLADIEKLYAKEGKSIAVPFNLIPPAAKSSSPAAQDTAADPASYEPLTFIHEYAFPTGPDTTHIKFPKPALIQADNKAWSTDIEFGREMLAGLNPLVIKRLEEFPIKSTLEASKYGDPTSAITAEHLKPGLEGLTVETALKEKRLFVQDYHDIFLPYLEKINALKNRVMYAPRVVLFLTKDNILKPLAIELALPENGKRNSRVFTPPSSGKDWVWELAKVHVASVDAAYHEVISHFLRTHACVEPFIIAANRQLSALHPVYQVLVPHFKNTMDINAAARKALINAGGIIELNFTPGHYTMEMSSVVYGLDWTFEEQALPNDLLKRGMAVKDPFAPHGIKLVIEDYPYAADGLELWGALKDYITDHVKIFYDRDAEVKNDPELQTFWNEVRNVGHGDKKDAKGWTTLDSIDSLVFTLTTIAWVASCHHAAVNFGQYHYSGYMPNHPSMTRKKIPEPGTPEWNTMQKDPERFYLDSISNVLQATSVMSTLEILSTHALDEEYLGQRHTPNWSNDDKVLKAFDKFSKRTQEIEQLIHERNSNPKLKNRVGPVQLPYELLLPTSTPGLTGKGVPYSISI